MSDDDFELELNDLDARPHDIDEDDADDITGGFFSGKGRNRKAARGKLGSGRKSGAGKSSTSGGPSKTGQFAFRKAKPKSFSFRRGRKAKRPTY